MRCGWALSGVLVVILLASCGRAVLAPAAGTVPEGAELKVLKQAGEAVHCPGQSTAEGARYRLTCAPAAGHSLNAIVERFACEADARAAFDVARAGRSLQCFQGRAAYAWQYDEQPGNVALPMRHRGHAWQAGRWLVTVQAFDDTPYAVVPAPEQVSRAIYEAAAAAGFFPKVQPTCAPH